jgi:hypothetical protein
VFAVPGELYAVYTPDTTKTATLDMSGASGSFRQRWYNEPWTPTVGSHTFTATPYSMSMPDANGTAGAPLKVDFVVTEE